MSKALKFPFFSIGIDFTVQSYKYWKSNFMDSKRMIMIEAMRVAYQRNGRGTFLLQSLLRTASVPIFVASTAHYDHVRSAPRFHFAGRPRSRLSASL